MDRSFRAARAALVFAGALTLLGATSIASAQRSRPRASPMGEPRPPRIGVYNPRVPDPRENGNAINDPRWTNLRERDDDWGAARRIRRIPNNVGSNVIIVPPGYGYGYGYNPYGYGGVYDVNGRPLSAGYQSEAPVEGFAYTPDLSGAPYRIADNGMMLVDFRNGDKRGFPSCATQQATSDPQGRPRTIFYQPPEYELVLGPGQRGRVEGTPPAGVVACYGLDSYGHTVLRY